MAFAVSSGMSPQAGIYCAVVTGFLISAFGGRTCRSAAPPAPSSWSCAGIVATYGVDGLFMCTMMAGVLLVDHGPDGNGHGRQVHPAPRRHRLHQRHRARHRQHADQGLPRNHGAMARCLASSSDVSRRSPFTSAPLLRRRPPSASASSCSSSSGIGWSPRVPGYIVALVAGPRSWRWRACPLRRSAPGSVGFRPGCPSCISRDSGPTSS